jgi:hypothetical protein
VAVTVTATASGAGSTAGIMLGARVVLNAKSTQSGATVNSETATTAQLAITPGTAGNWVYGVAGRGDAATNFSSLDANSTSIANNAQATLGANWGIYRSTSGTTTSSTTYGWAAPTITSGDLFIVSAEIQFSGTPSEDASTPAVVSTQTAQTITTASFSPPATAAIVACVLSEWTGSGAVTIALSDSNSAYTWTQVAATPTEALVSIWIGIPKLPSAFSPSSSRKNRGNIHRAMTWSSKGSPVAGVASKFSPPATSRYRHGATRKARTHRSSGSSVVLPVSSPGFLLTENGGFLLTEDAGYFETEVAPAATFAPPTSGAKGRHSAVKSRHSQSSGSPVTSTATPSPTEAAPTVQHHGTARKSRSLSSAGSPVVPGPVSPFTVPQKAVKGKPSAVKAKSPSSKGEPVAVPSSPFTPPEKIIRGHTADIKSRQVRSSGSPVIPGPVAPFNPPVKTVKGRPAAVKSRQSESSGSPVAFPVPVPSPFTVPEKAVKGSSADRKSRTTRSSGTPVTLGHTPSLFNAPQKAVKGDSEVRKSRTVTSKGSPVIPGPVSPFTPPEEAVKSKGTTRKSRTSSAKGSGVASNVTPSPFTLPGKAVKGRAASVKSRETVSKGSPVFLPPPQALFTATGTFGQATANGFTLTPGSVAYGEFILLWVTSETTADFATALSGSNMKWSVLVPHHAFTNPVGAPVVQTVFIGQPLSTSGVAQTITFSAGSPVIRVAWQEFNSPAGFKNIFLDAVGFVDTASNGTMPVVTPTHASDMYAGYVFDAGTGTAGSTTGYVYQVDTNDNQLAYNLNCTAATQTPNIGDTGGTSGIGVMLSVAPVTPVPPPPRKYSTMRRSRTNHSATQYSVTISRTVSLVPAQVTVTAYPLPAHALATAAVTVTAHPLVPLFSGGTRLAAAEQDITAYPVTAFAAPPVVVNLNTATVHPSAHLIAYTPPVLVYLPVAQARQSVSRVGPPNPLLMTVTPNSGVDDFGNSYTAGFHIYSGTTNGSRVSLQSTNDTYGALPTITYTPPGVTNVSLAPQTFGYQYNAGATNQSTWLIHTSGKTNSQDDAAIQLTGQSGDGSDEAAITFEFGGTLAMTVSKTVILAAVPFNSLPMMKNPPSVLPDTNKGQLYVDSSGALIYFSPAGTATVVVAGP